MSKNFAGFCLLTTNVIRLRDFYRDVLEAEVEGGSAHSGVHLDAFSFALFDPTKSDGFKELGDNANGNGSVILEFEVEDVDAEYKRLSENTNVRFLKPPQTNPWGRRAMHFLDPDGNVVNFHQVVSIK